MIYFCLFMTFLLGAVIGSFLNVCVHRLPIGKSIIWPGSRCGSCFQAISKWDNIPLFSWLILRGRCRACGAKFSFRYLIVEWLTALGFAGLFYLVIVKNVHQFITVDQQLHVMKMGGFPSSQVWIIWAYHAVLFSFLMVASFSDLEHQAIPLSVTVAGTIVGLAWAPFVPWPWPNALRPEASSVLVSQKRPDGLPAAPPTAFARQQQPDLPFWFRSMDKPPEQGLCPWPLWDPLPAWLAPGGNWQTGLANALVGLLVGTLALRIIAFVFKHGLNKEGLGIGDADIMMMAGAFLGWQPVLVSFFVAVFPGMFFALGHSAWQTLFVSKEKRDFRIPFGPSLALGILITWLGWRQLGPHLQLLLFNGTLLAIMAGVCIAFMFLTSFGMRIMGLSSGEDEEEVDPEGDAEKTEVTGDTPATTSPDAGAKLTPSPGPIITPARQPILIVDYGMGNLRSVQKAFEKLGHPAIISADPNRIAEAFKVVLPGVGAFQDAIARLKEVGFVAPLRDHVKKGKPFLGICLGLQLLFTRSFEDGEHEGLDLFPGDVVRFPETPGLKVPHMGWNQLHIRKPAPELLGIAEGSAVYFVHSYYCVPRDSSIIAAETDYPTPFAAAIWHENVFATQFHPEKSQKVGLAMLRNFGELQ